MTWYETPSIVSLNSECSGEYPLGMESGLITRQQISASTMWDKYHAPHLGRLNFVSGRGLKGSWVSRPENLNQWFQVDFGRNVKITKVATQGRQDQAQYVTKYMLKYSPDGSSNFMKYQENGADKVFNGNTDHTSVVTNTLATPITARYVQIRPTDWIRHISLRAEFYGCVLSDKYQVMGRTVHMEYVEEQLRAKKLVKFGDTQDRANNIDLEVLADTIYVKTSVKMRGIRKLTMFSRKVEFLQGSKLDLNAPTLSQRFPEQSAGDDGIDGKQGVVGPTVEIYADIASGHINIETNGGNGNRGQNGNDGKAGVPSLHEQPDKNLDDCKSSVLRDDNGDVTNCDRDLQGLKGKTGGHGCHGGYAGKSGKGGDAGRQTLNIRILQGNIVLKTCRGTGGQASVNGRGGAGGAGGQGGLGIECRTKRIRIPYSSFELFECITKETLPRRQGSTGESGNNGQTAVGPGANGNVQQSYLTKQSLEGTAIGKYPLALIKLMVRLAEDRVWANDITMAQTIFRFIVTLTQERNEASELLSFARRRLAFVNRPGFDRFGRNKLFAPLQKWEAIRNDVVKIRDYARDYERAYNGIQASIERGENTKQIVEALPTSTEVKINSEKDRLVEARRVALTEKGAYVPVGFSFIGLLKLNR